MVVLRFGGVSSRLKFVRAGCSSISSPQLSTPNSLANLATCLFVSGKLSQLGVSSLCTMISDRRYGVAAINGCIGWEVAERPNDE
jgi:hypothetical protein